MLIVLVKNNFLSSVDYVNIRTLLDYMEALKLQPNFQITSLIQKRAIQKRPLISGRRFDHFILKRKGSEYPPIKLKNLLNDIILCIYINSLVLHYQVSLLP